MDTSDDDRTADWNGAAAVNWVAAQDLTDRILAPLLDVLVDAVMATAPGTVLDVGCGTGATTVELARRLGPDGGCTGVDVSAAMVAAARRRPGADAPGVQFLEADAQRHRFEPGGHDTAASRFGVMFFDDPVAAFANLRAAVPQGGRLAFVCWRDPEQNPFMTTAERAAAPLLEIPPRTPDAAGQFGLADRARIVDVLARSGWRDVAVEPVDPVCALPEPDLPRYVTTLGPVGRLLTGADDALRTRVRERVVPAFAPFVSDGLVRFTAACWLVTARR